MGINCCGGEEVGQDMHEFIGGDYQIQTKTKVGNSLRYEFWVNPEGNFKNLKFVSEDYVDNSEK